ncbi:MAG: DinB family protein [Phycisphaerales bacterium]|nr:MAG: DinB family protein [Phycisphaerales bacterium]
MKSGPTDLYASDPHAYLAKITALVGQRDRLEVLSETADVLAEIAGRHSVEQMRSRPFEGKWTPNEVVGHLGDTEWVFGYRIRSILCEENPKLRAMNQELWVTGQRHNNRDPDDLIETFGHLRRVNLSLWRRISPADLRRVGTHNERGAQSLDKILLMQAGHDLSHLDQLTRYLVAVTSKG